MEVEGRRGGGPGDAAEGGARGQPPPGHPPSQAAGTAAAARLCGPRASQPRQAPQAAPPAHQPSIMFLITAMVCIVNGWSLYCCSFSWTCRGGWESAGAGL